MLPFRLGLVVVALLIAFTHGASIYAAVNDDHVEYNDEVQRSKRSYKRGQTQSQYLNFGQPELDGKAEAEATDTGSRSTVSGTHGMGQAQSQFSSGDCSGCGVGSPVYEYSTGSPDPLTLGGGVIYSDGKPSPIISGAGGAFGPGTVGMSQAGRPGGDFTSGRGGALAPGVSGTPGQMRQPGVSGGFAPGTGSAGAPGPGASFAPGVGQIGKPGTGGAYGPGGVGQLGAPGTAFGTGYGPVAGSGGIGQQMAPGVGKPGIGAIGQRGQPQLISPPSAQPGYTQEQQPGTGLRTQVPGYGPGVGQQMPTYIPGGGFTQPGSGQPIQSSGKPQVPQYGVGGEQVPSYGTGGRRPTDVAGQPGQQIPSYGQPGQRGGVSQAPGQNVAQPGTFYRPATTSSFAPGQQQGPQYGTDQQTSGYPQQPSYTPGYRGQIVGGRQPAAALQPGTQYPGTSPQQILQQPGGIQQGVGGGVGPAGQPGASYSQPGTGISPGQAGGYQPGVGFGQPGIGVQQGRVPSSGFVQPGAAVQPSVGVQPGVGFGQPGYSQQGRVQPSGSFVQPGMGIQQGSYQPATGQPVAGGQPGHIKTSGGFVQPGTGIQPGARFPGSQHPGAGFGQPGSGVQRGTGYIQPGVVIQPGSPGAGIQQGIGISHGAGPEQQTVLTQPSGLQPGTGFDQRGTGYQPGATFGPQKPGTGVQQAPGYTPGYGPAIQPGSGTGFNQQPITDGGYQPGATFGQPGSTQQSGFVQPGHQQPGQMGTAVQPGNRFGQQQGGQPDIGVLPGTGAPSGVGVQPGAGVQQGAGILPGAGVHPGAGFSQYPGAGASRPGAGYIQQPSGGVQPDTGIQQGAGTLQGVGVGQYPGTGVSQPGAGYVQQGVGTGYDTTYGQQHRVGQPGAGYGQQVGATQYGQPVYEDTGTQREPSATGVQAPSSGVETGYGQPGTGVTQYGQGPQQIVQPGQAPRAGVETGYGLPGTGVTQYGQGPQLIGSPGTGGVQPSGQQGVAGSGSLAAGVSGADDAFSQAESSIGNGQAAASAQGKKNGGTAKTQVQGTYSSSGSFSASAMTSDNDRSASSQVTGGVEGAMSQSQGQGGAAQSQAQVQINEKTGGTKASSQSGGIIHQSQSEVQANDKGGLADAQSSGPGQTSSQAQIGFRPGQDGEIVRSTGGGQASAQSGIHSGNSQSQIQGTSKYGVSYHGAAQSASGTKEQVATYREQNRDLFNTISQFGSTDAVTDRIDTVYNPSLTSESDIPDLQLKSSKTNKEVENSNKLDDDSNLHDEDDEEEPYDEYEEEEDYYNENPIKMETKTDGDKKLDSSSLYRTHTQTSPTQTQQVAVADPSKKYSVVQNQNGRVQKYPTRTTTETVPSGFRGTVNVEKKFHTKSLEPHKSENKLNITADEKPEHKLRTPDSYVTVTKSVTGSMDNSKNPPEDSKNFQSTFYTKSSTCGYFTFSCNIVYGANGRSKICRPKAPTNGKC